jgi:DNA-binding MarR family transcriptional regulator
VTTAAATGIIDRLVRCGYVARAYDPKDRRVINVGLTSRGTAMVKRISRQRKQVILDVFGAISKKERDAYLSVLLHIRDILSDEK